MEGLAQAEEGDAAGGRLPGFDGEDDRLWIAPAAQSDGHLLISGQNVQLTVPGDQPPLSDHGVGPPAAEAVEDGRHFILLGRLGPLDANGFDPAALDLEGRRFALDHG